MKVLLGRKKVMTQLFREDGSIVPVTLVEAGPCIVTAIRTNENGQKTMSVGYGSKKNIAKPQREDWGDLGMFALVREFPVSEGDVVERGQEINVASFTIGEKINVVGTTKGRGTQGVVKRHRFHGHPSSHGHKDQERHSGSIGSGGNQRVFKGMRMGGRMGGDRVTVKNLEVVEIDSKNNTIAVKGAIPGAPGSFITIVSTKGNVWQM
ncbi:MAG: 50S ribosomal protein L3 [Patescibacteria group bacterium]